jgi:hypothetical protein
MFKNLKKNWQVYGNLKDSEEKMQLHKGSDACGVTYDDITDRMEAAGVVALQEWSVESHSM